MYGMGIPRQVAAGAKACECETSSGTQVAPWEAGTTERLGQVAGRGKTQRGQLGWLRSWRFILGGHRKVLSEGELCT